MSKELLYYGVYYMGIIWELYGHYVGIIWALCGFYMGIIWAVCGHYMGIMWALACFNKRKKYLFLFINRENLTRMS
jgi:hypothetical protein